MNVHDMHLLFAAEVTNPIVTIGTTSQQLIELVLICQHQGSRIALPKTYLNAEAARAVALQLLEAADRADGVDRTRPVN